MRLLYGLSSLQGEGKVMSLCMHMRVHVCVCVRVPSRRACLQLGHGVERAWVCLAVDRKVLQRDPRGAAGPGEPQDQTARPEGARAVSLVLNFGPGRAVPQGCPWVLCWTQRARFLGLSSRGKHSSGEAVFSSKASLLRRKSRLPARRTAPFVLSGV